MKNKRRSGVLMPIASMPSKYGIGGFSKEAYAFVDFLEKAGQKLWQLLPLGPTGYGDSPYQSFSTFAGNPYFIDLEALIAENLLTKEECEQAEYGDNPRYVDYEKIYYSRFEILRKAFTRSDFRERAEYKSFVAENAYWLEDYALYMAVKNSFGGKSWSEWDEDIRTRKESALASCRKKYATDIDFYKFQQFLFCTQWEKLKEYANKKGISIVGDIPIYVAFDSADTWSNPKLFQFDENLMPTGVAGCPPDAFSATGQLWGNPLYDWNYHKKSGYDWWMKRIAYCYKLYDIVRIDHFRGFDEYYNIPFGDETAENGKWEQGPAYDIFATMKEKLGKKEVIAEDLGFLTPTVEKLVKKTGYPGMKILLFAFDSREPSNYLPHNYGHNHVVYTGTHDNDTVEGWLQSANRRDVAYACKYLGVKRKKDFRVALIRAALASTADTVIIPIQDYLGLDNSARINTPSTLGENWKWRLLDGECTDSLAEEIKKMVHLYVRG